MQKDLQHLSGPDYASIGTEGQSYEFVVQQQQSVGAIESIALHIQV